MSSISSQEPLIAKKGATSSPTPPTSKLAPRGSYIIPILAGVRTAMGVSLLAAPQLLCRLMLFSPQAAASSTILTRMSGSREIGLGFATWLAYCHYTRDTPGDAAARDLLYKVLLWGNLLVDGSDTVGSLIAFLTSPEEASTGALLAPAGLFAVVLGLLGLTSV
jgi:hypothetical protein